MRSLIMPLALIFFAVLSSAHAGSYCENFMPDQYRRCAEALDSGSNRTFGNWHLSLAGSASELQLYPFNAPGVSDITLVVACKDTHKIGMLRPTETLPKQGDISVLSRGKLVWKSTWAKNQDGQWELEQPVGLLKSLAEENIDTIQIKLSHSVNNLSKLSQTYHTLGTRQAIDALSCKPPHYAASI
jgi:hypothetical protein